MKLDLIINNATIITMTGKGIGMIFDSSVGVKDDKIVCVDNSATIKKLYTAKEVIDAKGKLVMPGFVNTHTHGSAILYRGLLADIEFYLEQGLAGLADSATKHNAVVGTRLHLLEGIKSGTTTYCDNTSHLADIATVYEKMGVRGRLSNCLREMGWDFKDMLDGLYSFDRVYAERDFKEISDALNVSGNNVDDLVSYMVSFQALDFVSEELILELKELARKHDVMMTTHLSQSVYEMQQCEGRYGMSPVNVLEKFGLLNSNMLAAHLVFNSPEDNLKAAKAGLNMACCPTSFAPDGYAPPATEYILAGGTVGLGTDEAVNNCANMLNEMKTELIMSGLNARERGIRPIPMWKILRMATIDAAKAIGMEDKIGSIEVGKKADIIILDLDHPNYTPILRKPLSNIAQTIVCSSYGNEVNTVIVDGKIIMSERKFLDIDEKGIKEEAQKEAEIASENGYKYYQTLEDSEVLEQQKFYVES